MTRTVLITGCSTGIGRAAAESFLADGWATYAEDGMGVDSSNISYPHNGDD